MITKRMVKVDKHHFLEYIDDSTGITIKRMLLDEAEYKNETIKIMVDGYMKENQDVTYREVFPSVSKGHPDILNLNKTKVGSDDITDKVRNDLISEFMEQNKDISYKEAVLAVWFFQPQYPCFPCVL